MAEHGALPHSVLAEADAPPFENARFGAVIAVHVLCHVNDPRRALEDLHRVVGLSGRMVVSADASDNMSALAARAFEGLGRDRGASRFSLDDAERLMGGMSVEVRRHGRLDTPQVADPDDAVAHLPSMPPGHDANADTQRLPTGIVHVEAGREGGTLRITKRVEPGEGCRSG